jgi:phosphatidylethanolamine/phosphatidyl-N-methylethanolamine N-methyltransferase
MEEIAVTAPALVAHVRRFREWLAFARAFAASPRTVGSIAPSSAALASRICKAAHLPDAKTVIEIGPGTGAVTRHLIRAVSPGTRLVLLEISGNFAIRLRCEFGSVEVVRGDALHLRRIAQMHDLDGADTIISSLPLANLSSADRMSILKQVRKTLRPGGRFVAYQYGASVLDEVREVFDRTEVSRVFRNLPPALVYVCTSPERDPMS